MQWHLKLWWSNFGKHAVLRIGPWTPYILFHHMGLCHKFNISAGFLFTVICIIKDNTVFFPKIDFPPIQIQKHLFNRYTLQLCFLTSSVMVLFILRDKETKIQSEFEPQFTHLKFWSTYHLANYGTSPSMVT